MRKWSLAECQIHENVAQLPLTDQKRNVVAHTLIDVADWDTAAIGRWQLHRTKSGLYVSRTAQGHRVYLHRLLLQAPKELEVDHRNRDTLDNRRVNLRLATRPLNAQNLPIQRGKRHSQYRGVTKAVRTGKWIAQVYLDGKNHYLGQFEIEESAAEAAAAFRRERMPYSEF